MNNTGRITKSSLSEKFTTIPNEFLRNKNLSFKSKGLLSCILSFPSDWKLYKGNLTEYCTDGKDSIRTAWEELENAGYIKSTVVRDDKGRISGYNYEVSDFPVYKCEKDKDNPISGNPQSVIPISVGAISENPPYTNTDNTTKKEETKKESSSGYFFAKVFEILQSEYPTVALTLIQKEAQRFCEKYNERDISNIKALAKTWGDRMPKEETEPIRKGDDLFQYVWKEVKAQAPNGDWAWQKYAAQEIIAKNNKIKDSDVSLLVTAFIEASRKSKRHNSTVQA